MSMRRGRLEALQAVRGVTASCCAGVREGSTLLSECELHTKSMLLLVTARSEGNRACLISCRRMAPGS